MKYETDGIYLGDEYYKATKVSCDDGGTAFAPEFVSFVGYEGETLDLTGLDTSNMTSMNGMFAGCSNLTSLDLSSFDTTNVTDMGGMFDYCENLTSLDLSSFNISNVEEMGNMFNGCSSLQELDIRNFDFSNEPRVHDLFFNVPSSCVIYINQDAYDYLEDKYNNGNEIYLEDLSMLHVVS